MYDDPKPKNDFTAEYGKFKNEDYAVRERGGCLTVFLGFIAVVNVLLLVLTWMTVSSAPAYADTGLLNMLLMLQVVMTGAALLCVWGLWNWKRWGYYGLMALYVISMIINVLSGAAATIGGSIAGMAILYFLMKDKMDYLE